MKLFLALLLTAIVGSSACAADTNYIFAQRPICKFRYDESLETRALSVLQRELGSGAMYYDAKRPIVTICHSKAELMFSGDLSRNGNTLLDPPHIFIDVDVCSHRILKVDRDKGTVITNDPPCE